MTEPTDVAHDVVVASRRRFLRKGGALMGGAVLAGDGAPGLAASAKQSGSDLIRAAGARAAAVRLLTKT